jgi:hypothetical protein
VKRRVQKVVAARNEGLHEKVVDWHTPSNKPLSIFVHDKGKYHTGSQKMNELNTRRCQQSQFSKLTA